MPRMSAHAHTHTMYIYNLTSKQEGYEACLFGHVKFQSGATEHVLNHSLRAASSLQEWQELLGFLGFLWRESQKGLFISTLEAFITA